MDPPATRIFTPARIVAIYLAWVNRDWSATTKTTGFAAAAGGALVGAWLGFHATTGLLALITAIAAAAAGTNLLLLALDISWDRQVRDRFTDTNAKQTLDAHPPPANRHQAGQAPPDGNAS